MNLEQVAHYIAHPQQLTLEEVPALKLLCEKYPYASVFSLLYLTALANGKSTDLDAALQQHAYKLSDRTQLYHLVHPSGQVTEPESVLPPVPHEITIEEEEEVQTTAEMTPSEPILHDETAFVVIPETEEPAIPLTPLTEPTVSISDFETITEAFTREQFFEIESDDTPESSGDGEIISFIPDETTEATDSAEETTSEEPESIPEEEESPSEDENLHDTVPDADAHISKRSFTSWLKVTHDTETPEADNHDSLQDVAQPQEEKVEKTRVDEIIDTFIKEEPTITRNKTEFYSPSKKAKESLDEEALPVSETLARIFAAQGNYPKAIHVYHQLMLSFPEKKSLFADQIEALKKKLTT